MNKKSRRFLSLLLSCALVLTSALGWFTPVSASAADVVCSDVINYTASTQESAASERGLTEKVEDGVILHCWNWSFDTIKNEIPAIAAAGFSAVQTSPIQMNKDGATGVSGTGDWWKFYQPINFEIGNALGTRDQFKAMCDTAHQYGVKVIVDVVANHLANNRTGRNTRDERCSQIPSNIRDNDEYWHMNDLTGTDDGNRWSMTNGPIGMPDLNTGSTGLQNIIIGFLEDAMNCGADGFRFDAAKHIETPSDDGFGSQFWARVASATKAKKADVFLYGEILNTAGPGGYSDIQRYTPYIRVTNNKYGHTVQNSVKDWKANYVTVLSGCGIFGENGKEWVLWNESHDTFAGEYGDSTRGFTEEQMIYAWCAVAARYPAALYFSRPQSQAVSGGMGVHSQAYKDNRIVQMNLFHNQFAGQTEYASNYENMLVVERGTTGVAIVNYNRSGASVNIKMNKMADGTYKDQVSGNTFTVSGGYLKGNLGDSGVACIYNKGPVVLDPMPTISQEGGNFTSDTLSLTIGLSNAKSGTYKIGSGSATNYTSSKTITIGSGMNVGDSVTVTLTATDGSKTNTKTYTFKKTEKSNNVAWLALPSGWSAPYCYIYDKVTEVNNGTWPGQAMTKDSNSGYYYCEVPDTITTPMVIFYGGSDSNRYPEANQPGTELTGSMIYKDGTWKAYDGGEVHGGDDIVLPDVPSGHTRLFFKNAGSWSTVNCYSWKKNTETSVAPWPGSAMTVADSKNGIYYADINTSSGFNMVIFNNNTGDSGKTADLDIPADGNNMFTWGGGWSTYTVASTEKGKVIVSYVDASGNSIATAVTLTGKVGDSYTTTAKTISGYTLKTTPSNATGKYTKADISVKYIYQPVSSGPSVTASLASGSSFKTERQKITLTLSNADSGTYKVDNGITKSFTGSKTIEIGEGKIADSTITVEVTATKGSTTNRQTLSYTKVFNGTVNETTTNAGAALSNSSLDSQYKTGTSTTSKTITVDGDISDWTSAMLIAQGAANDDPRVYRENSMHEVPIDLYALYATYDNSNLYLMWEMTNVQDVVANYDGLDYPLSQGILYETQDLPFFIAIDTRKSSDKIGNDCKSSTGDTIWNSGLTFKQNVTRIVATNTKATKAFVYGGTSAGLDLVELYNLATSGITMKYGKGILSSSVKGINKAFGTSGGRTVGDMTKGATYVDFNSLGHTSSKYDFHYEMAIPFTTLGVTASEVQNNGLGVQLFATFGKSGMDCLPYDVAMNDNADQPDTESQPDNSYEKSDADCITVPMGSVAKGGSAIVIDDPTPDPGTELVLNFGADRSAPQSTGTALSLLGKPSGGSGSYTKYQYYVNGTLLGTKTSQTAVTWTPSAAGKYAIKCIVTDSNGKTVTSSKYFTVEGGITVEYKPTPTLTAGDKQIKATWTKLSGASKYRVFTYVNSKYTKIGDTTSNTYTVTGLTNGVKYGIYVIAYAEGAWQESDKSHIKYATPAAGTTTEYKPTPTLTAGNKQIKATWTKLSGATNYRVFTYVNSKYTKVGETTSNTYTVTGLTNGVKYGIYVLAYANGKWQESDTSHIKYATPTAGTTTEYKPTPTLTAGDKQIKVVWTALSGATNYRVFTYVDGKYTKVAETTNHGVVVKNLKNGTKYGIYVLAYANGKWQESDTSHIRYATPTAGSTGSTTDYKPVITLTPGDKQIKVTWTAISEASAYRVFTYVNGKYTKVAETTNHGVYVKNLTNGINYGIYVIACVNGTWVTSDDAHIKYAKPTA